MAEIGGQGASKAPSTDRIEQLIYVSKSRHSVASAMEMSDILAEARPANARDGITGVLTAVGGRFVQIVEGAPAALDGLMGRLLKDPRHHDLRVLQRRTASVRTFGDWDMVSPKLVPGEVALLELLLDEPGAGLDDVIPTLEHAVAHQEAILEGRRSGPAGPVGASPPRLSDTKTDL